MNELEKILDNRPVRPPMISTLALNQRWQSLAARPRRSKSHSPSDAAGLVPMPLAHSSPTSPTQSATLHDMTNLRKSASSVSIDGGGVADPRQHHHRVVAHSWNQRVPACRMQWLTGNATVTDGDIDTPTTPPSSTSSISISLPETPTSADKHSNKSTRTISSSD